MQLNSRNLIGCYCCDWGKDNATQSTEENLGLQIWIAETLSRFELAVFNSSVFCCATQDSYSKCWKILLIDLDVRSVFLFIKCEISSWLLLKIALMPQTTSDYIKYITLFSDINQILVLMVSGLINVTSQHEGGTVTSWASMSLHRIIWSTSYWCRFNPGCPSCCNPSISPGLRLVPNILPKSGNPAVVGNWQCLTHWPFHNCP